MSGVERRYTVAVAGATGAVGSTLLTVLEEVEFPVGKLHLLGRDSDEPESTVFANRSHAIKGLADFDFSHVELAIFCVPADVAGAHVARARDAGAQVIDLSEHSRLDRHVPLVVPSVNGALLSAAPQFVAAPAAPVVQAAAVLAPLRDAGLVSVTAHTALSVSARGKAAVAELAGQSARLLNAQALKQGLFPAQIAFNLIAAFDALGADGYTDEERHFEAELRKVLAVETLAVQASFAVAPVFYGHSQVLEIETVESLDAKAVARLLSAADGVRVLKRARTLSPVGDGVGCDEVLVGRIRSGRDNRITLWTVADNIRKGAAVNTAQIALALLKAHP